MLRRTFAEVLRISPTGFGPDPEALSAVGPILDDIARRGDAAVRAAAARFGVRSRGDLRVPQALVERALRQLPQEVVDALQRAAIGIRKFAKAQRKQVAHLDLKRGGIGAGHRALPLDRVGVYVPAGRHPLPTTALMTIVPARVAGVQEIVVCSPPTDRGEVHPAILAAASLAGATAIFRVGGAQAIAAMAIGTKTIPRVDKVVGPGNRYVAAAKALVAMRGWCGIDGLAGPSELCCVVDGSSDPALAAAELCAQAEHDPEARLWLVGTTARSVKGVLSTLSALLAAIPEPNRSDAESSLSRAIAVECGSLMNAARLSDALAPEHLTLLVKNPRGALRRFTRYGAAFLGRYSPVATGDYGAGPNHTLPTGGAARFASGLSVHTFFRFPTHLELSARGLRSLAPDFTRLAALEGLHGHAQTLALYRR